MSKIISIAVVTALAAQAFGQADVTFEAPDFNVTQALIDNGVDVSTIPELSGLVERTLDLAPCSIAVSFVL